MASYTIRGKLEGLEAALKKLDRLKQSMQNKILRKAITEGNRIVQREAKALAPVGETRLLRQSMGSRVQTYKSRNLVVGIIGPRTGVQRTRRGPRKQTKLGAKFQAAGHNPSKVAHLVERGHVIRRKKGGPILGQVRAHEFMRPAFERTKAQVAEAIARRIGEEVLKEAMKK